MQTHNYFKTVAAAILLVQSWAFTPGTLMAQDNIWANGPQLVDFNDPATQASVCTFPTDPAENRYHGQVPQYSQNAQYDEDGNLLFFVVDGNIYDHAGYLMADNDMAPDNCIDCMVKGLQEMLITHMPGTCDKYYVIGGNKIGEFTAFGYGILDLSKSNHFFPGRYGALWKHEDVGSNLLLDQQMSSSLPGIAEPQSVNDPSPQRRVCALGTSKTSDGIDGNIHLCILDGPAGTEPPTLFVQLGESLKYCPVTDQGITDEQVLRALEDGDGLPYSGGIAVSKTASDGIVRLARTGNRLNTPDGGANISIEISKVTFSGLIPSDVVLAQVNTDITGTQAGAGCVHGLAFSPNGRYLFFSQATMPYIGYIDMLDPTYAVHDLVAQLGQTPSVMSAYGNGQIACNKGPLPNTWSMYFPKANGFGRLDNIDDAATLTGTDWTATATPGAGSFAAPPNSLISSTHSPSWNHYLMDRQNYRDQQLPHLQEQVCCQDNEKIPEASHMLEFSGQTLFSHPWTPMDNGLTGAIFCAPTNVVALEDHASFEEDFVLHAGARLFVRDMDWRFAPDAHLIIEPGAFVQFDNCILQGTLDENCDPRKWPGVELRGTPALAQGGFQYPPDQGRMVFNNSTLQDALVGVTAGKKNQFGMVQYAGGILETTNSTFLNCHVGVNFYPYQNRLPNGNPTRNRSKFVSTTFTVDDNYIAPLDFAIHAQMWKVDGIDFMACIFENLRSTEHNSSQLGQGIRSLDAQYNVLTLCGDPGPNPSGICQNVLPTRFTGLDMGIRAANAATSRNFTVDGGLFESNVCGVYANGVADYVVVNSHLKIGGSIATAYTNVDEYDWHDRHRGVYSFKSSGFAVDDNTLEQDGTHTQTEGIVIGYSGGNNDIVFRNSAESLESAYIGEGICAEVDIPGKAAKIGLQFLCNQNSNNATNIWSRKVTSDQGDQNKHTIRLNQGGPARPADNTFDQWPTSSSNWDFKVTTTNSPIGYWHSGAAPYVPVHYTTGLTGIFPQLSSFIPEDNCASKYTHLGPPVPPNPGPMSGLMDDERTAYTDVKYLYDQLIDGGQPEVVTLQIEMSWPQDAWALRDYLMGQSPNLSVTALKDMVLRNIMPAAMATEVLTANPGATRTDGFLTWLQEESGHPLPEYLLNMVVASWDQRGYRDALMSEMALHHTAMSQAANWLVQHYRSDTTSTPLDSIASTLRQLGTVGAHYDEAMTWMEAGNWTKATTSIDTLSAEPEKKGYDVVEQQRMLDLIGFLEDVHDQGRDESQLDSAEVATLQSLMGDAYDRPANWISNLLCFGYGHCRAPLTGGDGRAHPKMLQVASPQTAPSAQLDIYPNPASSWVTFHYELQSKPERAELLVRDAAGRTVYRVALQASEQQQLWDTREVASGSYSVVLLNAGRELRTEKLIVKQ